MSWLWINIPLMVLFGSAVAGIPLWLVLRRPDFGPEPAAARARISDDAWKLELAHATR